MRIIPAIDIIAGKCVRLSQGDYNTKVVYNENPLEVAKAFEDHGIRHLHLVDLDGAKAKRIINYKILERIAAHTSLSIDFGGGLRTEKDLEIAMGSGARQVTGGSIAVDQPDLFFSWLERFGSEKIILGADARDEKVAINGWTEDSGRDLLDFIGEYVSRGTRYVICTDVGKDGMLQGPSTGLYEKILKRFSEISLIASGGVASLQDLLKLRETGCDGAILGKAIYEGRISLKELAHFIIKKD